MPNKNGKTRNRLLVIDDDKEFLGELAESLCNAGYEVVTASNCVDGLNLIREKAHDLILLDVMMPDIDGFDVKERLNKDVSTASIPVIFLTAKAGLRDKIKGLNLGVDDYVTKPFDPDELLARIGSALRKRSFYEEISMTDGLTGLYNIHFFKKQLKTFFAMAKRYKQIFSLAIIDINGFKDINDTYGHMAGDCVLKSFSSVAKKVLRDADIITRYGGDEFAVILPSINKKQAKTAMGRLKSEIDGKTFLCNDSDISVAFSISVGIAEYKDSLKDENELFELADAMMYKDKGIKKQS